MSYAYYDILRELEGNRDVFDALPMFKAHFGTMILPEIFTIFCDYEKFYFCKTITEDFINELHEFQSSYGGFYPTCFNHLELENEVKEIDLREFVDKPFEKALITIGDKRNVYDFGVYFSKHINYINAGILLKIKLFGNNPASYQLFVAERILTDKWREEAFKEQH